jgi:endonuclease/exonuclease/phosphatase family metal-dependent hydrolase
MSSSPHPPTSDALTSPPPPARRWWRRRAAGVSAGVVLVLAGACGVASLMRDAPAAAGSASCRRSIAPAGTGAPPSVRWTWAYDDAARLEQWCQAVGPAVVRAPSIASAAVDDSIAVVTWNVHVGGGDIPMLIDSLRAGRLTGGAPVGDFVLLLQEALRVDSTQVPLDLPPGAGVAQEIVEAPPGLGRHPLDVTRIADSLGLSLMYAPSMRNGLLSRSDRGNAILSTLPLHDVEAIELPFEAQRRVAVSALVTGRSGAGCAWTARVTSVHLDNWSGPAHLFRGFGTGRLRQGKGLLAGLAGRDTTPVHVTAGDLNTARGSAEEVVELFRGAFKQSPTPLYVRTHASGFHLDHVFVRDPAGRPRFSVRAASRFGSDHWPIATWVRVAPRTCPNATESGPST